MQIRAAVLEEFAAPLRVQDVDSFVSHRLTLDDVNRGFELMHDQDGIRSVMTFS